MRKIIIHNHLGARDNEYGKVTKVGGYTIEQIEAGKWEVSGPGGTVFKKSEEAAKAYAHAGRSR